MRVTTESAIEISESLAGFLLGSYLHNVKSIDPLIEKRLKHVNTGKFSIADLYYPSKDMAIEMKSRAHGNSALKGVVQASMYKEQADNATFCMQKPRRRALRNTLESMCGTYGVGLVYITSIPNICSHDTIEKATGGCAKPFELWKRDRYSTTKNNIIVKSRTNWCDEYIETLEQIIIEKKDDIFEFAVPPDSNKPGLNDIHSNTSFI